MYKASITSILQNLVIDWELKEKYSSLCLFVVLLSEVQLHAINSGPKILNGTF